MNLLMAAGVFLPVFLISEVVELELRGVDLTKPSIRYHASAAIVIYVSMLLPILLGSVVHSAALLLVPRAVPRWIRRIATIALASLLPFTVILLDLSEAFALTGYWVSTFLATVAYGIGCSYRELA